MKEHVDVSVKESRTISNTPKASKQMFNHVDNRIAIQRAVKEVKYTEDLNSLTFEQLSFFESQRIRKETFGECMKTWNNEIVIKDDDNPFIWSDIERKYNTERVGNAPVLYELMTDTALATHEFIYPGLDSCLGITITNKTLKKGTHLVLPLEENGFKKYIEQLRELNVFFTEGDNVHIACKNLDDIEMHKQYVSSIGQEFAEKAARLKEDASKNDVLQKDAVEAAEILKKFSLRASGKKDDNLPIDGFKSKEAKVEEAPDVQTKYNANTIHTIS